MRIRPCEICGSIEAELLHERRFTPLPGALLAGYDVTTCRDCGFCFAQDLPDTSAFDRYYEEQSKYEFHQREGAPSEYDSRRLPAAAALIAEWMPNREARILDIGCATGGLLAALRDAGFHQLLGIDPSPACARAARQHHGIEVLTAPLSRIPAEIGSFDLIVFGSVMEHLLDLNATLERISPLLKEHGCVFVEVPDVTRCTRLGDAPFQEFSVEHINFFSPKSLSNLWSKHGYSAVGLRQTEIVHVANLVAYEIKAMFRKGSGATSVPIFDDQAGPELRRYIANATSALAPVAAILRELALRETSVIVWGAGTHTQGLLATTPLRDVKIRAFIDSNARYAGQTLAGVPVLSPAEAARFDEPILISSQQFQVEILDEIKNLRRLPNAVITLYPEGLKRQSDTPST